MTKDEIVSILKEIGILLDLKGENHFKCLAYANAARALESLHEDLGVLIQEERLGKIKGIGRALEEKITALYATGKLPYYEELKASLPPGLLDCLRIPGLGPKKVKVLWEQLEVDSIGDLRMSCERGMVANLDGFGEKTQSKILEGIRHLEKYRGQFLYSEALRVALLIYETLKEWPAVEKIQMAGSLRRKKEVVRDIDFVVSTKEPESVMKFFVSLPEVEQVTNQGRTKSSVILNTGIQADVRCVSEEEFPFALAYFTGSKEHNIAMRQRSIMRGQKLNEYGLFKVDGDRETSIPCQDEVELYRQLGLDYIEPELREDMGEIPAAERGELPKLVSEKNIRGAFHCHTQWSDGRDTIEQMARAAIAMGWEYLGISDHSKSSAVANGLNEKRLCRQIEEIEEWNRRFAEDGIPFRIFSGNEVDVLGDGSLDFSDELLSRLDFVVASIHQGFGGDEAKQTARILNAIANPYVTMLGHPTGRLLLSREPYKVNLNSVIEAAAAHHTIIELNCTPSRMELDWRWWKGAREKGVMSSINPDAHSIEELAQISLGVDIARKGWLRSQDVLNTHPLDAAVQRLKQKRGESKNPAKSR